MIFTLRCCCYLTDPLQIVNVLPKTGFVPGETIPITIEIRNKTDVRINSVCVKLKEKLTFTAEGPETDKRFKTTTLKEHNFRTSAVPRYQTKQFHTEFYLDPSYNWKLYTGCDIITCEYYIKSEGAACGWHSNPKNTTMITIGTIPFTETSTNGPEYPGTLTDTVPTAPSILNATAPIDGVIVEQPLPLYHEVGGVEPKDSFSAGSSGMRRTLVLSPSGLTSLCKCYFTFT